MKNILITTVVALMSVGVLASTTFPFGAIKTFAIENYVHDGKITLCHASPPDTAAQGWNSQDVSINSTDANGHDGHAADIIPPYHYDFTQGQTHYVGDYPGKNFDTTGIAIWNNDCKIPTPTTTPTPTNTPTPTPTPTGTVTPTATPSATATPTPTDTPAVGGAGDGLSDGRSDGRSDGLSTGGSTTPSTVLNDPYKGVLGTSTMAGTGTFTTMLMNIMFSFGVLSLGVGVKLYAKTKNA